MIPNICRRLPLIALVAALFIPHLASAQGREIVTPDVVAQGTPQKNAVGLTPAQIRRAYGFDLILNPTQLAPPIMYNQGAGQTIAIINAFHDPTAEQDLSTFSRQFHLPGADFHTLYSCNGQPCAHGSSDIPFQPANPNYQVWALEISLDIEWAHAIAPKATIVLVEVQPTGTTPDGNLAATLDNLLGGVDVALKSSFKPTVVSMSWGGPEFSGETKEDVHFSSASGVTFFASAGDSGHGVLYPAASPYVMSVGGTKLNVDAVGNYQNEKAWKSTGGGPSSQELEPGFQLSYPIPGNSLGGRGTPDVSYNGAPDTGVAVYDGQPYGTSSGWMQVGGTSAGPPQWSGLIAIANALRQFLHKSAITSTVSDAALYDAAKVFPGDAPYHDITNGSDGNCGTQCKAKPGYDYVTGLGTPRANLLVPTLVLQP